MLPTKQNSMSTYARVGVLRSSSLWGHRREGADFDAGDDSASSLADSPPFWEVYPDLLRPYGGEGSSSTTPPTTGEFGTQSLEV
jgi:hypothetical protein